MIKLIKKILLLILLIAIISISILIFKGYNLYKSSIAENPIVSTIQEIQEKENFIKYDDLPKNFVNAVISVEDKRFFTHNGIDLISINRAIITNIKAKRFKEGGSTITQQVAKNVFFSQKKEVSRKIAEIFAVRDIEKNFSKEEIFEIYVNTNFYGSGYYGIYDASKGYFNKEPHDLNNYESTMLAGIPNAPSVYSPKANLELANRRQRIVINQMLELDFLTQNEVDEIINEQEKHKW